MTMSGLALSPALARDPIELGPDANAPGKILEAIGISVSGPPALVVLAPRVVLLHVPDSAVIQMLWIQLPHGPSLRGDAADIRIAIVLVTGKADAGTTLRFVSRLKACLGKPGVVDRALSARSREDVARLLTPAEAEAGEPPLESADVFALLRSSPGGLSQREATDRLERHGPNHLEQVAHRSLVRRLLSELSSFFALLLWVGSGLALLAGLSELGWAIVAVIVVNGIFSFVQEYRAERALEALRNLMPYQVTVVRDGVETRRPAIEIVPGDVVRLAEGDRVPADGQLLLGSGLRIDQSALTGEPQPVFKVPDHREIREPVSRAERPDLVFAGTGVVAGSGSFVVVATGMATEIGSIARLTQTIGEHPSPLQREMASVTRIVTALAVSIGVGFFVVGVSTARLTVTQGFLFALGVIVANVPEGLLPTLTIALAMGARRLAARRSLVKRLSAVEGLGATTVICTDKTGTLTENRMSVRFVWTSGRTVPGDRVQAAIEHAESDLLEAAVLASQAVSERGDPLEVALVTLAKTAGLSPIELSAAHPIIAPHPFDSFRKRMTLVRATDKGAVAFVKGAPKELLALCQSIRWDAAERPLTDDIRHAILVEHDRLAMSGLRLLAVAVRSQMDELVGAPVTDVERDLTFLGFFALWDPPRPEVKDAIALCRRAGIRIVMITGDYGLTAQAIARQIGLAAEKVVTGEELERLPADATRALIAEPGVLFARISPAHKLGIVTGLQALGEVVAVTGDGVNDAPALKAAHTGVAMGQRGSDVAKEAAEVVITDDNFASIVAAIREGRATYANMGKFVTYIFASNIPELVPFLAFVLAGIPLPLTIMQILAVDLGTDLLPALALGTEVPEPDVMDRPPRTRDERLLGTGRLLRAYAFLGLAEAILALFAFFWTYWLAGWRPGLPMAADGDLYRRATTMTLAGIVAAQIGNVFACRTDRASVFRVGLGSNRLVLGGIAADIAILLVLIVVPPLPRIFGLAPPHLAEWCVLLIFPVVMLGLEEGRKWVIRNARSLKQPSVTRPIPAR